MEKQRKLLSVSSFNKSELHVTGLKTTVPISKLLLKLNEVANEINYGEDEYHIHEDSLYEPIKKKLVEHLPDPKLVLIKNAYPEKMKGKETDISIRKICQVEKLRNAKDMECSHYVEIKSLFLDENLLSNLIDKDLNKLSKVVGHYKVVGLFALVGLQKDILRRNRSLTNLGKLGEDVSPFMVTTCTGEDVWLNPAGSHISSDPHVYVWEISPINDFKERKSSYEYATFQYK
ncbi:hypothetical protein PE36_18850 [Moritella sp. PE36]|uniref:hypothetical protein n=1 Tax=Moritella sp. PE36 TaxID=58051 RepID=UPI0001568708|nr:hypothetical protein [Moritella sp. PE36]EDM67898.1 hypothetical protein PE36_18850 [Moritella sp. PE36]